MQFLADYFPLLLFFAAFEVWDIYVATAVAIVASIAQIAYFHWGRGKVQVVHWLSFGVILVFGGATLIFHDETFIKWKPTVVYWLFAAILAVGRLAFRRNLIAVLLKDIKLPDAVWARVTWAWVAFLAALGGANLYVATHFPTRIWVLFKVPGAIALSILFAAATVVSVARYLPERPSS
jgi:intracellular septation protein